MFGFVFEMLDVGYREVEVEVEVEATPVVVLKLS